MSRREIRLEAMNHCGTAIVDNESGSTGGRTVSSAASGILEIGMHATTHGGLDRFFHVGLVRTLTIRAIPHQAFVFGSPSPDASNATSLGPFALAAPRRLWRIRRGAQAYLAGKINPLIVTHFALYALPILDQLLLLPHVVHFQGPWSGESAVEGQSRLVVFAKRQIESLVYRSADRIIVLSEAFKNQQAEEFSIYPKNIVVIPGAIEAAAFSCGVLREKARELLNLPDNRKIVLCVRRLVHRMGLEELLEAMVTVRSRHSDVLLLVAGKGPLNERLASQIASLGLSDHVRLLGFVPDAELPLLYRAADLSVVPSQALEGFGLITLESLAAGTPVLVTPIGGLPETVKALEEALILPGPSAAHIAEGLISAMDGRLPLPSEDQCKSYVKANFDWNVIAPRVLRVYEEVLCEV